MDITNKIIKSINNNIPISFSKYGDGEYLCASNNFVNDKNCDNDKYTKKLSEAIKESFKYMVNNQNNNYLGMWKTDNTIIKYWESIVDKKVNWVNYWSLLPYDNNIEKKEIFKSIKKSKLKKIYICNELLIKAKILLNIDHMVFIPLNNWFDNEYNCILEKIKEIIGNEDGNHIVMTSCGMSAKVLICDLYKIYPKGIYLDIGSGLDTICTKRSTRGLAFDYNIALNYFNDLIPDDWNNPEYDYIYKISNDKLGIHLPKVNIE